VIEETSFEKTGEAIVEACEGVARELQEGEQAKEPEHVSTRIMVLMWPDHKLRIKSRLIGAEDVEIIDIDPETGFAIIDRKAIRELAAKMVYVMKTPVELPFGKETIRIPRNLSVSAPQVGHNIRLIVVEPSPDNPDDESGFALVNPVIVERHGSEKALECSTSFPGLVIPVARPKTIVVTAEVIGEPVSAKDVFEGLVNRKVTIQFDGVQARAVCQAIDHLDGMLFIDRAPAIYGGKITKFKKKMMLLLREHKMIETLENGGDIDMGSMLNNALMDGERQ